MRPDTGPHRGYGWQQETHPDPLVSQAVPHAPQRGSQPVPQDDAPHAPQRASHPQHVLSVMSVGDVLRLMNERTATLPRTRQAVELLLGDSSFSIRLPQDAEYIRHGREIVSSIDDKLRYKIGMTFCPHHRFYESTWAYSKNRQQVRDNTRWDHMLILYCHHCRDTVAMLETALINIQGGACSRRCRNRRTAFDDYKRFDHGSDDERAMPGPYFCYVVTGVPQP